MLGLLSLFVLLPALELYLLILLGTQVGALTTFGLIVLTGFAGAALVRQQGFDVYRRMQRESAEGRVPALELVEGLVLLVAGAFLLTPGLLTDAFGFLALIPGLRRRAARQLADQMARVGSMTVLSVRVGGPHRPRSPDASPRPPETGSARGPIVDVTSYPVDSSRDQRPPS